MYKTVLKEYDINIHELCERVHIAYFFGRTGIIYFFLKTNSNNVKYDSTFAKSI
jgi:hypothetical protein